MLRIMPFVTLAVLLGPVLAGLWGTILPAFGHFPVAGLHGPSLDPFRALLDWPGLGAAVRLSVVTGAVSTVLSLGIVMLFVAGWSGTRSFAMAVRILSPLLSVPHAAAAFGLAALIAPSGWIMRALSPWATGMTRPPDILIPGDPWGAALIAGLVVKEVPFLLLMTLAALPQTRAAQAGQLASTLGYGRVTGWLKTVFPLVYAQIRLPVYVVLGFAMSVVDVAVILGPTTPPPLSVQVVRWMSDPDLTLRSVAAAGALLQLGLVLAALMLWWLVERGLARAGLWWVTSGTRSAGDAGLRGLGLLGGMASAWAVALGIAALAVWSVAGFWSFPDIWPDGISLRTWARHWPDARAALWDTGLVAGLSVAIAIVLVLTCLEAERAHGRRMGRRALWLLYLPLLIPQTAFLPGLQGFLLSFGADRGLAPVVLAHLVFVLPYVFLSLGDPWRAWDARFASIAGALGASPARVFWRVRLPMLLRPVLTALAVGVAVSVGQYLPTLLIGGGRIATLTTEAVALASGGDRRAIGVWGLLQTGAALLPFALALIMPWWVFRNRRGLRHD